MPKCDDVNMNIVRGSDSGLGYNRCCPSLIAGPTGPMGVPSAVGSTGPTGPTGEAATSSNALAYTVAASTVAAGAEVPLETVNIQGPDISQSDANTLLLQPGTYLVQFVSDVSGTNADFGAALQNTAGIITNAASIINVNGVGEERIVLSSILNVTEADTLSVVNNTSDELTYQRSSLTVTKLD